MKITNKAPQTIDVAINPPNNAVPLIAMPPPNSSRSAMSNITPITINKMGSVFIYLGCRLSLYEVVVWESD